MENDSFRLISHFVVFYLTVNAQRKYSYKQPKMQIITLVQDEDVRFPGTLPAKQSKERCV